MVDDKSVDTAVVEGSAEQVDAETEDIGGFSRGDVQHNMKFLIMMDVIMIMGWADFQVALMIAMALSIASYPLIRWLTSVLSDDARSYA